MEIRKAVLKAIASGGAIRRKSCVFRVKLVPTNTSDGIVTVFEDENRPPVKWWNPSADDLTATDWEVIPR